MGSRWRLLAGLTPLILCITAIAVIYLVWPPPHPTACDHEIEALLLDASAQPAGSLMGQPNRTPSVSVDVGGGDGACQVEYGVVFGHAFHVVFRFEDEAAGIRAYQRLAETAFYARPGLDLPWSADNSVDTRVLDADEVYAACTPRVGYTPRCAAVGRYGRYLFLFETEMNTQHMTVVDFSRVLSVIDEQFSRFPLEGQD